MLDLAAGTGKLTTSLLARGYCVEAVEPLPGMRARLELAHPGLHAIDGRAEQVPLADGSLDAVFVGQAFHWFEPQAGLGEIARVLRPGGWLVLLGNLWDLEDPAQSALDAIVAPLATGRIRTLTPASHPYGSWPGVLADDVRFADAAPSRVAHTVELDSGQIAAGSPRSARCSRRRRRRGTMRSAALARSSQACPADAARSPT